MSNYMPPLLILLLIGYNRSWFIYIRFIRGPQIVLLHGMGPVMFPK